MPVRDRQISVSVLVLCLSDFFYLLSFHSFALSILDCGRLLEVLPPFVFTDDAFFLNHSLETLYSFFQRFFVVDFNVSDRKSPPLSLLFP